MSWTKYLNQLLKSNRKEDWNGNFTTMEKWYLLYLFAFFYSSLVIQKDMTSSVASSSATLGR